MKMSSLEDLFLHELKDLYSAENQIIKALPKMEKNATSPELKKAFQEHLEKTRGHAQRLEQIFEMLEGTPKGKKCKAVEGLVEEGKDIMGEDLEPAVLDAALIAAAQKVEHYEMAAYGCVRTWAQQLGQEQAAKLLQQTLDEEAEADKTLTQIAESFVNAQATAGASEE
jgi:ferritin-like metal-binding protein YciE